MRLASAPLLLALVAHAHAQEGSPDQVEPRLPDLGKMHRTRPLEPEAAMATIELPDGFSLELVACEPMIHEPACVAWDGNGRMYVAEMRTYMQDIDGSGKFEPRSRVSRLEDTDGDGRMDKHTVFIDRLVLPRMILTLQDGIIVRETNTFDLWEYRDQDGDGVADWQQKVFEGGPCGGNLEHQPSGLDWNIDNRLYVTYTDRRYRYVDGAIVAEKLPMGAGQWGMTHDDVGQPWFSSAGGEVAATCFQQNPQYGRLSLPGEMPDEFSAVWPIDDIPDVQGGEGRIRADNSLNHFTASCGQLIFRGDRLPADLYGDLFICEPVGRLIRRARVDDVRGKKVLTNVYGESEFVRSKDANFRPINLYTGPDGTLYIVDMYRGIIQEGNWVQRGSYLRDIVQEYGLDRNIGRGRIYRLRHRDFAPGAAPRLLDETSSALVAHLAHANGWWRDEAQKLLVLRQDRSVVPALRTLADEGPPLARLHALWTLDGLGDLDRATVLAKLDDADARVRSAAIRLSERWINPEDPDAELVAAVTAKADDADPAVPLQLIRTAFHVELPEHIALIDRILAAHPDNEGMQGAAKAHLDRIAAERAEAERLAELRHREAELAAAVERGTTIYQSFCFACHGPDGKGAPVPGDPIARLAPTLIGSPRVLGSKERLTRILLHGLTGPVDDQTYLGVMIPMASNGDAWIADVLSYVRNTWGNDAGIVTANDVTGIRESSAGRAQPWTLAELRPFDPILQQRQRWKLTASHGGGELQHAIDGDAGSRWTTGTEQQPGMWLCIEFPFPVEIDAVDLDTTGSARDFPARYELRTSADGESFGEPIAAGDGSEDSVIRFASVRTRWLKIEQTGAKEGLYWSVHELSAYGEFHPLPAAAHR